MKTIKYKHKDNKKIILNHQQHANSLHQTNNNKQISTHAKISTNSTINSLYMINHSNNYKSKSKKNKNSTHIYEVPEEKKGLQTSKSTKKLKVPELKIKKNQQITSIDQQSFRQYYLIGDTFVPITKSEEKKSFQYLFSKTASTSTQFNNFKVPPKSCHFQQKFQLNLQRSIRSNYSKSQSLVQFNHKFESKIPSSKQIMKDCDINVQNKVEYSEMGIQYSQRKQQIKKNQIQESIQTNFESQSKNEIKQKKQNVSDILFQLQFSHLSNQKSFTNLSSQEKQHFSQLLETLLQKLKPKKPPILAPINLNDPAEELNNQSIVKLNKIMEFNNLEHLIKLRQCQQMNLIEVQEYQQQINGVNTSVLAVISTLCNLFCYIQMQQTDNFLFSIRTIYGLSFRQKYIRISRNIPLVTNRDFKILDENVLINFVNQSNIYNCYEAIHLRAIFDAFNQYLQQYRPFYHSNGEPFPWSFKMFVNLSEYSIDEDSFQIIFRQAKQTIIDWCSNLCGLHVQNPYKDLQGDNPLKSKLMQNQRKLIIKWIQQQNFEKGQLQIQSTKLLNQIGQLLWEQLLEQFLIQFNKSV